MLDRAAVDRTGTISFDGTARCQFQHRSDGLPEAQWTWTGENEGLFWYEIRGWADQAAGRKTLLHGGGGGYVDCTNTDADGLSRWSWQVRAENGRFGPSLTNFYFQIGASTGCDGSGCGFNQIAELGGYVKVARGK